MLIYSFGQHALPKKILASLAAFSSSHSFVLLMNHQICGGKRESLFGN